MVIACEKRLRVLRGRFVFVGLVREGERQVWMCPWGRYVVERFAVSSCLSENESAVNVCER